MHFHQAYKQTTRFSALFRASVFLFFILLTNHLHASEDANDKQCANYFLHNLGFLRSPEEIKIHSRLNRKVLKNIDSKLQYSQQDLQSRDWLLEQLYNKNQVQKIRQLGSYRHNEFLYQLALSYIQIARRYIISEHHNSRFIFLLSNSRIDSYPGTSLLAFSDHRADIALKKMKAFNFILDFIEKEKSEFGYLDFIRLDKPLSYVLHDHESDELRLAALENRDLAKILSRKHEDSQPSKNFYTDSNILSLINEASYVFPSFIYFPTFIKAGYETINALAYDVIPLGLTTGFINYDDDIGSSIDYNWHDQVHAYRITNLSYSLSPEQLTYLKSLYHFIAERSAKKQNKILRILINQSIFSLYQEVLSSNEFQQNMEILFADANEWNHALYNKVEENIQKSIESKTSVYGLAFNKDASRIEISTFKELYIRQVYYNIMEAILEHDASYLHKPIYTPRKL